MRVAAFVGALFVCASATAGTFQWPVTSPNPVNNGYATFNAIGNSKYHAGLDITSSTGNLTIRAAAAGTVRAVPNGTYANSNHGMGHVVIIDHNSGRGPFTLYAHLASISVSTGQFVSAGTQIGVMGNTGTGAAPGANIHLHFEVKRWGVLGNLHDDLGPIWGYTTGYPNLWGYENPWPYLDYNVSIATSTVTLGSTQTIRTGPDASLYTLNLATAYSGQRYVAAASYNGWYEIEFPSSQGPATGWVQASPNASLTRLEVNDPTRGTIGVRVRSSATVNSSEVSMTWDNQEHVQTASPSPGAGCTAQWYPIDLASNATTTAGWVCGDYLIVPQPPSSGTINVNATLNGSSWSGSLSASVSGASTASFTQVPASSSNRAAGSYTLSYNGGGPSNATLSSITPSSTQTLSGGSSITFTLNFTSTPTNGTISIAATLGGSPWSGTISASVNGPIFVGFGQTPASASNVPPGSYTLTYNNGGPPGATLSSITPSATQTLGSGGSITFTLNFTTPPPSTGTVNVNATLDGAPWSGAVDVDVNGPGLIAVGQVPASATNQQAGTYTLEFDGGGPPGASLASITPSATQTLGGGSSITFILNFATVPPLAPVPGDFDGDRRSDLFWRKSSSGQNAVWLMNGTSESSAAFISSLGSAWQLGGIGDFNADGRNDLVWRNGDTGDNAVWLMNGTAIASGIYAPNASPGAWTLAGVGDFDGDRRADLVWRNHSTLAVVVWLMNGAAIVNSATVATPPSGWELSAVGDFNGDAKADLLWRNPSTHAAAVWLMNGLAVGSSAYVASPSASWIVKGVGDFDNDARFDILWRSTATYETVIWLMNGLAIKSSGYTSSTAPSHWDAQAVGDFNGDGRADVMWRSSGSGENAIWLMNGFALAGSGYPTPVPDPAFNVLGPR